MGYSIRSRDYFWIGATKSTDVGLNVEHLQPPPMAVQQYTQYATGADMDGGSPDNYFENIQYTIEARVLRSPNAFSGTDIYALFASARTLTLSCCPDYYFKIRRVLSVLPSSDYRYKGNEIVYEIALELAPFKWHIDNQPTEITVGTITNPGNRYSRPKYVITDIPSGTTSITLNVNGQQFVISNLTSASTTITIDSEKLMCYDQRTAQYGNLMPNSTGQIPFLATGVNTAYTSAGTLTITGNWRSY